MSSPREDDLRALHHLAQYLRGSPRPVYHYPWQAYVGLHVFVDTDFDGCQETRASTSGGMICRGDHLVKRWSVAQQSITLSSYGAEMGGDVNGGWRRVSGFRPWPQTWA